ncbi:MAG: hypothetical protein IT210_13455 [Armatimonadetes bacterium]|nr:hypothetical protein [Armatimonadota bacterium]
MKAFKNIALVIGLFLFVGMSAYGEISRDQAVQTAQAFLKSLEVPVGQEAPEVSMARLPGTQEPTWYVIWPQAFVQAHRETGRILWFHATRQIEEINQRLSQKEAPLLTNETEAIEQARAFADRMALPLSETSVQAALAYRPKAAAGDSSAGIWNVLFQRQLRGYTTPDSFWVWVEPYEKRVVEFKINWNTPECDTDVLVPENRAVRLALDGLAARGIPAVLDEKHPPASRLSVLRPNYAWTEYALPSQSVPFARLAWVIAVAQPEGAPIGNVWIDAANGDWLGGGLAGGALLSVKSVPLAANAKAFLMSRFARAESIQVYRLTGDHAPILRTGGTGQQAKLASLLACLKPGRPAIKQTVRSWIVWPVQGKQYRLAQGQGVFRLQGPDVPGGSLYFTAGSHFKTKLTAILPALVRK